ncbi:MAG: 2-hydroxyacyl-CoA dehydratase subunit D, partial [Candidatus Aminicenantales bacterium]
SIKDSDIAEAIRIYNETRDLMVKLYQLRKQVPPFLSGTVVAEVVRASQIMSKIEFNQKLSKFLEEVGKQKNRSSEFKGPRIMVVGSILPNNKLIDIIEQAGAVVVCDDLCTGSRYFEEKVEEGPDLLKAIAQRYLGKAPCARMKATELRLERAKKMAAEFKVEGIIYQSVKFCDNHLYDYPLYRSYFHKMGLPLLQLEDDFKGGNIGQLRTRVEAFIEML